MKQKLMWALGALLVVMIVALVFAAWRLAS